MMDKSSLSTPSNNVMQLLRQLYLKLGFIQIGIKDNNEALPKKKFEDLNAKVKRRFTKLHKHMNLMSSQLNQIQEHINPME